MSYSYSDYNYVKSKYIGSNKCCNVSSSNNGITGATGDKGDRGPTGSSGSIGPTGPAGSSPTIYYAPVATVSGVLAGSSFAGTPIVLPEIGKEWSIQVAARSNTPTLADTSIGLTINLLGSVNNYPEIFDENSSGYVITSWTNAGPTQGFIGWSWNDRIDLSAEATDTFTPYFTIISNSIALPMDITYFITFTAIN